MRAGSNLNEPSVSDTFDYRAFQKKPVPAQP